uniref:RNA-directed DNA polymerase n=1 Tax=Fagus sylvatica TaxID=28930 RepID=A0A2N9GD13_FAGSY
MAEEASKLRGLEARVAALETKFNFLLQFIRRWTEREEEKKKATISKRQKEIYPALSLSKAAQTLPTPRRPAFHIPRPSRTEPRQFQPLPIPVLQLYTLLIKKKMITPVNQRTRIGPQPKDYNKDLTCEYHQGEVGHTVENCRVLRHQKDEEVDITSTKIPWEPLFHELKKRGLLPAPRAPKESTEAGTCQYHPGARDHNLQGCEEFKKEVAGLITKGLIRRRGEQPGERLHDNRPAETQPLREDKLPRQGWKELKRILRNSVRERKKSWGNSHQPHHWKCPGPIQWSSVMLPKKRSCFRQLQVSAVQSSEKVPSVVIQVPQPFPYQDSKRIPWNYGMKVISTRESKPKTKEEVVGNLTSGLGGITRSGRCYTPEELEKRRKEAGKAVEDPTKTKGNRGRGRRFPPNHQEKALLKVLNEAYVPEDITGPSFENMVTSILVTNQLTFSDDELPPEGRALNVCPLSTLEKLDIDPTRVRVNSMVVRAFDGTRREVLGEIDLPVEIGPQVYDINFQVLRIDSPYNLLLGRPWLHTAGAVPSSLHQKMKLIIGNQLVTILAEEPISIYNDGEIPYIDGCAPEEASFHSFEFVTVIHRVAAVEPRLSKAGIMVAKEFVKAGFQPGQGMDWGIPRPEGIVRWPMKPGGKELQRSSKERNGLRGRWSIPHIRATFPASAMFQVDEGDVDELALLFTEDLNVNAITTEGDSAAFPVHADQHEEIDLEDFLDEENLKGYRIDEETLDEDTWEPQGAFLDRYRHNTTSQRARQRSLPKGEEHSPPPSNIITTTTAEEEYAGPMVEGLSIHTIAGEEDSTTTPPTRHCQQGEEVKTWTCVPLLQRVSKPREVKIGTRCAAEQKEALIALLREFHEIFAWSYQDMPGLDTDIVVHKIPLKPECKPVKQALRRMKPEVILKIKEEVEKQLKAGFLSTVTYSDWVANIVPVPKKDGKVRMCVDYRDLNRASPKDNFPLPHIDTLVDNTATNVVFSFMDGFSGYNQIKMAEEDKSKTAFITHWGTFVYDVMPFGLKNAGATYQRAMVTLFHDMIHHEIEKYQLRLNPNKCAFGVTSGKLLGFIVSGRGIEIDPAKLASSHSLRRTCEPLFKLLRKDVKIKWTEDCQRAFDKIKEYLLNPPILVPPTPGRPLILYLTVQEASMGCMLGQQDETGKKEQAIYYLSKKFTEPETRYLLVEKTCCALAWASKKLRQYMLYYTTWLVSRMDPIKYIFEKPALTGKIARWQVLLSEFDILFVARKAIKGQAIADYLADYPSEQLELMDSEFPDEDGQQTPIAVKLGFDCTNNMTEYEACIVGLQAALEFGAYELEVFGDSLLIVSQTNGEWQARDPKLIPYQRYISRLVPKFKYVTFTYTPRAHNHFADALATLASLIKLVEGDDVRPLRIETRDIPAYCVCIEECMNVEAEIDNKPWYYDIKRFIQDREYPPRATENEKKYIRRMAFQFFLSGEILHVQTCHKCQMYQNSKNAPPQYLHTMASPWPFSAWGMDVIGAITPKASNGHEFILVAIDYFTKWVEACSFKNVTQVAVTRFVKNNIICRYGMPENAHHRQCFQPKQPHDGSAMPAVQDPAPQLCSIPSEDERSRRSCQQELRTSVGATPYSLVYGMEAVLPVEVEIPSLRILSQTQLEEAEWAQARYEQLNFIDEKRLAALCHGQLYQRRIERAYNKKARPRTFQPGDLVLKKRNMALSDPRGKFAPSYEGPYVVKKAFSGGAIILADMDGEEFRSPINSDSVIKYHV